MARGILGIIVGYLVYSLMVGSTLLAIAHAVGEERLLDATTGNISNWFIFVIEWPMSLITAVISGLLVAIIAGRKERENAVRGLAMVILAFGIFGAAMSLIEEKRGGGAEAEAELAGPVENSAELMAAGQMEAEEAGRTEVVIAELPGKPFWDAVLLPCVTAFGVMIGGGLLSNRAMAVNQEAEHS